MFSKTRSFGTADATEPIHMIDEARPRPTGVARTTLWASDEGHRIDVHGRRQLVIHVEPTDHIGGLGPIGHAVRVTSHAGYANGPARRRLRGAERRPGLLPDPNPLQRVSAGKGLKTR